MKDNRLYENKDLEIKIKKIINDNNDYFDAIKENNYFEFHYFLSHLRHDLFNWYPFKKEGSILEIGASYGQLTSLFTQKVNRVVAVEDTKSKSEIISTRARDAEVCVFDFDNIELNEKFDYIILCDTFEYSKSFFESDSPYEDYLRYLKGFLKDDGVILIAISNRLGLKYFAGFKEEHYNKFFKGINGYSDVDESETFSKSELIDIINNSGFDNYKFFYPYPNHQFPMVIHTDELVNKLPYERQTVYYDDRANFIREDKLNQTLAKDNIADLFSNSFLIEIRNSNKSYKTDELSFIKLNSDRRENFRTCTTINLNGTVSKFPISSNAFNHVKKMYDEKDSTIGKIKYLNCEFDKETLTYDFLTEKSLEELFFETIKNNDKEAFFKLFDSYYEALFYNSFETNEYATDEFLSVFKVKSDLTFHCQNKSNLDLIFSNIFIINDEYVAIDYEWLFDFPIPLEYILYRVILHHRESNIVFRQFVTMTEIFDHYGLDTVNFKLFKKWNRNFKEYVFGKKDNQIIPIHTVYSITNIDSPEKIDEYMNLRLNSENVDRNRLENLKEDLIIKQRIAINNYSKKIKKTDKEIRKQDKIIYKQSKKIKKLKNQINCFSNSKSWKITKPLRKLRSKIR